MPIDLVGMFETLVKNKELSLSDGVVIKCGNEINLSIYNSENGVVIDVGSPSVHVSISKLGPAKLLNWLRPTIESITITPLSYKISLDNAPDIEIKRDDNDIS